MVGQSAFEIYLRTGRRITAQRLEKKFNPWHDPDDGRFTFAGQGRHFGSGAARGAERSGAGRGRGGGYGGGGASGRGATRQAETEFHRFDPRNPANHSIYFVSKGDTLAQIAASRKGLSAADLAWLNDIRIDQHLQPGQRLKLPNQSYLDAGRAARNNFMALAHYLDAMAACRRTLRSRHPCKINLPHPVRNSQEWVSI